MLQDVCMAARKVASLRNNQVCKHTLSIWIREKLSQDSMLLWPFLFYSTVSISIELGASCTVEDLSEDRGI